MTQLRRPQNDHVHPARVTRELRRRSPSRSNVPQLCVANRPRGPIRSGYRKHAPAVLAEPEPAVLMHRYDDSSQSRRADAVFVGIDPGLLKAMDALLSIHKVSHFTTSV